MYNDINQIALDLVNGTLQVPDSVNIKYNNNLTLFNYNNLAVQGDWSYFELISRGLIINNKTGEIVARPFDKFFNYGERNLTSTASIEYVDEKLDGSLGILYRDRESYKIATRGSFDSPQAQWATEYLNRNHYLKDLPSNLTLLFEIIYPDNQVVVNYNGEEALYLLAARNRFMGDYIGSNYVDFFAANYGFNRPTKYNFFNIEDIKLLLPDLSSGKEGFVVLFSDGQRFKFKGARYLELHRLISSLSFKNTIPLVKNNTHRVVRDQIPDEFLAEYDNWVNEIINTVSLIKTTSVICFNDAPKQSRKEFALYVMDKCKSVAPVLFAMLDGKSDDEIESIIYKLAFREV